ncbi:MAG: YkvA family protein [Woeseiaceae bacterium]|nr:YkvA family protein [Woeseiaceae bacterium]
MPLDITFTLSDQDLDHFQDIVDKAKAAMKNELDDKEVEEAARKLIDEARAASDLPEFIADRLSKLQVVINMLGDTEWKLGDEDRKRVLGALVYFCHAEDVIPDSVPGLGFLDDAIYVELVLRELKAEISWSGILQLSHCRGEPAARTGQGPASRP